RNNSLHHLVIGKGSYIPFNDTIIITAEPDGTIYFDSNNNDDRHWKTPITSDSEEQKSIAIIGLSESGFRVQFSKDNTSSSDSDDLSDSDKK
ncbi:MAG TPA: hypothetical protein VHX42_01360, partial [Candidatus Babeliales bacterium]|nr:hypothetical protein [Candidatus Babeliales bacterium]